MNRTDSNFPPPLSLPPVTASRQIDESVSSHGDDDDEQEEKRRRG
jgi:hypothetical protein